MMDKTSTNPTPEPFTTEWFDNLITANERVAQEKLSEYQQLMGGVSLLRQLRALTLGGKNGNVED